MSSFVFKIATSSEVYELTAARMVSFGQEGVPISLVSDWALAQEWIVTGTLAQSRASSITCCAVNLTPLFSTLSQLLICQRISETGFIKGLRSVRQVRLSSAYGVQLAHSQSQRAAMNLLKTILIVESSGFYRIILCKRVFGTRLGDRNLYQLLSHKEW